MTSIEIIVLGTPAPQGSKHGYAIKAKGAYTGKVAQVESSANVKPWRMAVKYAALEALPTRDGSAILTGAVSLEVVFRLPRPKGHYGTGRNQAILRGTAHLQPHGRPDLDKLLRSTFDALGEAGVWLDDSQVVNVIASKTYAGRTNQPGATIYIRSLPSVVTDLDVA